jgi:hypothetical protein
MAMGRIGLVVHRGFPESARWRACAGNQRNHRQEAAWNSLIAKSKLISYGTLVHSNLLMDAPSAAKGIIRGRLINGKVSVATICYPFTVSRREPVSCDEAAEGRAPANSALKVGLMGAP